MRTSVLCLVVSGTLLGGQACERRDEGLEEGREAIREQREDVREEREDVRGSLGEVAEEAKDVPGEVKDVQNQRGELEQARAQYIARAKQRIQVLQARIAQLEARGDAKSLATATRLRQQSTELSRQFENANTQTAAGWEKFRQSADKRLEEIERDLDKST